MKLKEQISSLENVKSEQEIQKIVYDKMSHKYLRKENYEKLFEILDDMPWNFVSFPMNTINRILLKKIDIEKIEGYKEKYFGEIVKEGKKVTWNGFGILIRSKDEIYELFKCYWVNG